MRFRRRSHNTAARLGPWSRAGSTGRRDDQHYGEDGSSRFAIQSNGFGTESDAVIFDSMAISELLDLQTQALTGVTALAAADFIFV